MDRSKGSGHEAVYLGIFLRERFPGSRWDLDDAGYGLELAVIDVPAGTARVIDRTRSALTRQTILPDRARRSGLWRRQNPLTDLLDRWSAAPAP